MSEIDIRDKNHTSCPFCGAIRININVTIDKLNQKSVVGFCRQCEEDFIISDSLVENSSQFEEDGHV